MSQILYLLRRHLPAKWVAWLRSTKYYLWRLVHGTPPDNAWNECYPWMSPNIFNRIVEHYRERSQPSVFEYGLGVSAFWHIRNLIPLGGTYCGVDHDPGWYRQVVTQIVGLLMDEGNGLEWAASASRDEVSFQVESGGKMSKIRLVLKEAAVPRYAGDGTREEFEEYVGALRESHDVIIVDGKARKACIDYILKHGWINTGGLLVVHDAWRGQDGWLGHPRLTGVDDYQPEIQQLISTGGVVEDGKGLDAWPGQTYRRAMGKTAFSYPYEAVFYVCLGAGAGTDAACCVDLPRE